MTNHITRIVPLLVAGTGLLLGCDQNASSSVSAASGAATLESLSLGSEPFIHRDELLIPKDAPTFELTDQNGNTVKSEDLAGKVALVGFVYTSCPDICRAITATYLDMQEEFAMEVDADALELVLITTDPERDTPEQAKEYTEGFGGKWAFLTGGAEELLDIWSAYHVTVKQRAGAAKNEHTWMVVLVDRSSQIRIRYMGQDVPTDVLTADVRALLEETP